jgi:hypothetical protein
MLIIASRASGFCFKILEIFVFAFIVIKALFIPKTAAQAILLSGLKHPNFQSDNKKARHRVLVIKL